MVQEAHAANVRVLEDVGRAQGRPRAALRLLQFLPGSRDDQGNAGDGGGTDGAGVDPRRDSGDLA